MKYIFGPIASRRFGLSLGIDLSPDEKICNFDCLYCELPSVKPKDKQSNPAKLEDILKELKEALIKFNYIDVITITANGEPTLYPFLNELIDEVNKIKDNKKSLILSNGSTIYKDKIQKALKKLDIVKLSLDCATNICFKKLDRAIEIDIDKTINGMINFKKEFKNSLIIEILFVKNINDKESEIKALKEALKRINPDRIDLNSIDRPPAYEVKGLSYNELFEIAKNFEGFNISIASRKNEKVIKSEFSESDILNTITKRPLTQNDVDLLFCEKSKKNLEELLTKNILSVKNIAGVDFFCKNY